MPLSRESILLENIKEARGLYERSLVWAIGAALAGGLIAIGLRDASIDRVSILWSYLSPPVAWAIAQLLYFVFGLLAYAAIRSYERCIEELGPSRELLEAINLAPSLALMPGRFFRLGSVILAPAATAASWWVELGREHRASAVVDWEWWIGLAMLIVILAAPYVAILTKLRELQIRVPRETTAGPPADRAPPAPEP